MSGRPKKKPAATAAAAETAPSGPSIAENAGPTQAPIAKTTPSIASTPLMRQYLSIKAQHTDAILFFRMGDFYEMFFEDAEVAARELDLTLTARDKNAGERVPLAGFPHHQLQPYVTKLLSRGYKIAVCDQTEDPKESRAKGKTIVERAVTRVLTPGLVVDEEALEAKAPSFLASVARRAARTGLAFLDISTGDLSVTEVDGDEEAWAEIERMRPREILLPAAAGDLRGRGPKIDPAAEIGDPLSARAARAVPPIPTTPRPASEFEAGRAGEVLKVQLGVVTLDGQGLAGMDAAVGAAGAAIGYARENARAALAHVQRVKPYTRAEALLIDEATRRNLEVFEASGGGRKGSLLDVMDATVTPMGGRMLRAWVASPRLDPAAIGARLDAVESLVAEPLSRDELKAELSGVYDLPRIVGRVATGQCGPRDLKALRESLGKVPAVVRLVEAIARSKKTRGDGSPLDAGRLAAILGRLDPCDDVAEDLRAVLADDPPLRVSEGGVIREGFDRELDEIHAIARDAKGWIAALETRERERTGIANLKVRYNGVFGYYLEVTTSQLAKVPADYVRKQTTAGGERYYTPELKTFEEKVLHAEEKQKALEATIFEALKARIAAHAARLLALADALAESDALVSLADRAAAWNWVKPVVDGSDRIELEAARHPVIEQMSLGERFVPNDVRLDEEARLLILTGPNMAGKSTVMRQTALLVLMAQAGSFVPAKRAEIGVVDRIFTRVGASDLLSRGQSTFMVEMSETANILHNATPRSLVVIDEIGRGTSTFDGVSIAWAVAEHLHDVVGAKTLFATHYHELTALSQAKPRARNFHIAVKEWNDQIVFLRKLVEGATSRSYGIQVARLAGLPESVLARARDVLADMTGTAPAPRLPHAAAATGPGAAQQMSLFAPPDDGFRKDVAAIEVETLTPLAAMNVLADLVEKARGAK